MLRRLSPLALCFMLLGFVGCNGNRTNQSSAFVATPTPTQVRSSADVVQLTAANVSLTGQTATDATVTLTIRNGFHVNANPATFDYLIPTELTAGSGEGISAGKPIYPRGVKQKFQFADQPLSVYESEAQITVPLTSNPGATIGNHSLPIKVRVQACDQEQCYPPANLDATISIEVK